MTPTLTIFRQFANLLYLKDHLQYWASFSFFFFISNPQQIPNPNWLRVVFFIATSSVVIFSVLGGWISLLFHAWDTQSPPLWALFFLVFTRGDHGGRAHQSDWINLKKIIQLRRSSILLAAIHRTIWTLEGNFLCSNHPSPRPEMFFSPLNLNISHRGWRPSEKKNPRDKIEFSTLTL